MSEIIRLEHITKSYSNQSDVRVTALKDVSLQVESGEIVAITGVSGSGKSTLLHIIGLVDSPDSGTRFVAGEISVRAKQTKLAIHRNRHIGFVLQDYALIPHLTVTENVELPLKYAHIRKKERREKCERILAEMGLGAFSGRRINELSGGQKQRIAIARAIINDPEILLADEPTGAIDSVTKKEILDLFLEQKSRGKTIVIVTHDAEVAGIADRIKHIRDGILE